MNFLWIFVAGMLFVDVILPIIEKLADFLMNLIQIKILRIAVDTVELQSRIDKTQDKQRAIGFNVEDADSDEDDDDCSNDKVRKE